MSQLSQEQKNRYLRNIIIDEIGDSGQQKLLQSNVAVIGAGGLGSSAIYYLAANGVGNIAIIDNDIVEISNLQRQIIHNYSDINLRKCQSAKNKVNLLNNDITIEAIDIRANKNNLGPIIKDYDIVLDCSDNFETRFAINEVCYHNSKLLISAAVKNFYGQLAIFNSGVNDPCYACFNHDDKKREQEMPAIQKGILGSVPGVMGSMQASMTINHILSIGDNMVGKMLICDFLKFAFRTIKITKNQSCKICSR